MDIELANNYGIFLHELRSFVKEWKSEKDPYVQFEKYLGDRPFEKFVLTAPEPASSWNDFLQWVNELEGSWCFRGQREAPWKLHTSLDRAIKVEYSKNHSDGSYSSGSWYLDHKTEQHELLFRFQQQAPRYLSDLPAIDDHASWFALMQHYGVPTCLLDWTRSPYKALYFAFADEPQGANAAVWAINLAWLTTRGQELLGSEAPTACTEYMNGSFRTVKPVIVEIKPRKINERIVAQEGILLYKLTHGTIFNQDLTFNQILMYMMSEVPDKPVLRRLFLKKELRINFLKHLQERNIHSVSLFQGFDGFCKSFKIALEIKVADEIQNIPSTAEFMKSRNSGERKKDMR